MFLSQVKRNVSWFVFLKDILHPRRIVQNIYLEFMFILIFRMPNRLLYGFIYKTLFTNEILYLEIYEVLRQDLALWPYLNKLNGCKRCEMAFKLKIREKSY